MRLVTVQARTVGRPELAATIAALDAGERLELNTAMGHEVQRVTVDYVTMIAQTRHATAERLGAAPTGYWAQAAEKIESGAALETDETAATLTLDHGGFARAFRDVTIRPKNGKFLAIPINAISYGRRAAEMWEEYHLFIKGGVVMMHDQAGGTGAIPVFALVRSVTQPQDRSLLPSDEMWATAATEGLKQYITFKMMEGAQ
jgi:hypothetical protein